MAGVADHMLKDPSKAAAYRLDSILRLLNDLDGLGELHEHLRVVSTSSTKLDSAPSDSSAMHRRIVSLGFNDWDRYEDKMAGTRHSLTQKFSGSRGDDDPEGFDLDLIATFTGLRKMPFFGQCGKSSTMVELCWTDLSWCSFFICESESDTGPRFMIADAKIHSSHPIGTNEIIKVTDVPAPQPRPESDNIMEMARIFLETEPGTNFSDIFDREDDDPR